VRDETPIKGGIRVGVPIGVKLTHIPTGLTATCTTERSHLQNRNVALAALTARVADHDAALKALKENP